MTDPQVQRTSRVGKRPVLVPKGVTIKLAGQRIDVQGPKGNLSLSLPEQVEVVHEGDKLTVSSTAEGSDAPRLQGLGRALLQNMVQGTATGFERILELVGTGYRAEVKGKQITLQLGYARPRVVDLPAGITAVVPPDSKGTQIVLTGADKALLGQVAADLRALRPPEPYGGKGVRYRNEAIRRKAGKAGKGRK
jgi:large subunit ribosomal protein L6